MRGCWRRIPLQRNYFRNGARIFGPLQSTWVISNVYIGSGEDCKIYLRTTAHGDIDRTCVPAERYSMANFGDLYSGNHYVQFKKVVVKTAY